VPPVIEAFRTSGAAAVLDARVVIKRRQRGLPPSQLVEGLFALWAAGGERCEDLVSLREDAALALLLGHGLPAPQTARDFLEAFDEALPPLWQGEKAHVPGAGERLQGLAAANRRPLIWLQARAPQAVATIDVDATILESQKQSALLTYDGRSGYQPVVALWAEQDVILAEEFRDGNVPAGTGNRRVVEQALAALPAGVAEVRLRGDSALYEQSLLRWLDARGVGYAISADMSRELAAALRALPESAWRAESEDSDAVRHWAEVPYVPSDGLAAKDRPVPPRYLALRISKKQGRLFADGGEVKHFAIVTNRPDPDGGSGRDLIQWQRGKAGTVEHRAPCADQRVGCRSAAEPEVRRERRVVPPQCHAVQSTQRLQTRCPAAGAAQRPTQAAALRAPERRWQSRASRPRDGAAAGRRGAPPTCRRRPTRARNRSAVGRRGLSAPLPLRHVPLPLRHVLPAMAMRPVRRHPSRSYRCELIAHYANPSFPPHTTAAHTSARAVGVRPQPPRAHARHPIREHWSRSERWRGGIKLPP
jgi:hypothetical protein